MYSWLEYRRFAEACQARIGLRATTSSHNADRRLPNPFTQLAAERRLAAASSSLGSNWRWSGPPNLHFRTTEYGCEEAEYHLAVALLDRRHARDQREVQDLLARAAEDGDYPQATDLLEQIGKESSLRICRCRRGLARRLGGKTHCALHRRPRVRQTRKA